jgi:hypothetical protein
MSDDQKEKAWDIIRACFWLLAVIICSQIVFSFAFFGACVYGVLSGAAPVGSCRDYVPNMGELLVGGMAIVMAFSGKGSKNG